MMCTYFYNLPPTADIYTLSLHDALPISGHARRYGPARAAGGRSSPDRVRLELRGPALRGRADGRRGPGPRVEHGGRHSDSAAVAHRPEPVRLLPAALRSGDESADRPAARDARHVVAHAPGPPRVALERPAVRRVAGRSRGGWG